VARVNVSHVIQALIILLVDPVHVIYAVQVSLILTVIKLHVFRVLQVPITLILVSRSAIHALQVPIILILEPILRQDALYVKGATSIQILDRRPVVSARLVPSPVVGRYFARSALLGRILRLGNHFVRLVSLGLSTLIKAQTHLKRVLNALLVLFCNITITLTNDTIVRNI
jgi:hypothetical protein